MSTLTVQEKNVFAIDAAHSSVEFLVRHLMISKVRGRFTDVQGSIELASGSNLPEAVEVIIGVESIDTREPQRDAHLRSADFFDAENFKEIRFKATRFEGDADEFTMYGDLTIHGITREVALNATVEGRGKDPWGGERVGYEAHGKIDRKDFGLTWNQALETGGFVVSDEVRLELNVEAVLKQ